METFRKDIEIISQVNNSGAMAGSSSAMTGKMSIDLSNIKNDVSETKNKKTGVLTTKKV